MFSITGRPNATRQPRRCQKGSQGSQGDAAGTRHNRPGIFTLMIGPWSPNEADTRTPRGKQANTRAPRGKRANTGAPTRQPLEPHRGNLLTQRRACAYEIKTRLRLRNQFNLVFKRLLHSHLSGVEIDSMAINPAAAMGTKIRFMDRTCMPHKCQLACLPLSNTRELQASNTIDISQRESRTLTPCHGTHAYRQGARHSPQPGSRL